MVIPHPKKNFTSELLQKTVFNDRPEHFQGGGPFDFLACLAGTGRVINGHFLDRISPTQEVSP